MEHTKAYQEFKKNGNVAYMDYSIDVTDKQTLYFDCFDKLSTRRVWLDR